MQKTNGTKKAPRLWITVGRGEDLDYFIENISLLVGSGMSLIECLRAVRKGLRSKSVRRIAEWIEKEVEAGASFSHSLERTRLFPSHAVSLIRIGEESGRLSQNLKLVSQQNKKERIFRTKLRSALMYPVFVLGLTLFVGVGIAWFILPKLALVFGQLRMELPTLTKVLIATGEFLSVYGSVAIPAFVISLVLVLYLVFYFPKTKGIGQSILFHMPGTGELIRQVEIARFSYLLGTLLTAGVPVVRAIESLEAAATFRRYKKFYKYLQTAINEGNSFRKSFDSYRRLDKLIPAPVQQLVVAGEQSGKLSQSLSDIADTYEAKIDTTTKNLAVMLEPLLLVIVWLGVVAVALAVILPIYSLVGGLNAGVPAEQAIPGEETERPEPIAESEDSVAAELPAITLPTLDVLSTGLGYLNVRDQPSLEGQVIAEVFPEETYEFIAESDGWYRIILSDETEGWVFEEYVILNETQ